MRKEEKACTRWVSKGQRSRGQACSFQHDPANKVLFHKKRGQDKEALLHHLAESALIQMANEGGRVLQERQPNHVGSSSNQGSVTRESFGRLGFLPKASFAKGTLQQREHMPVLSSRRKHESRRRQEDKDRVHLRRSEPHREAGGDPTQSPQRWSVSEVVTADHKVLSKDSAT